MECAPVGLDRDQEQHEDLDLVLERSQHFRMVLGMWRAGPDTSQLVQWTLGARLDALRGMRTIVVTTLDMRRRLQCRAGRAECNVRVIEMGERRVGVWLCRR